MMEQLRQILRRVGVPSILGPSRVQFILLYWITVGLALAGVQPIKQHAWQTIQRLGDEALAARQFERAKLQYAKLHLVNLSSAEPDRYLERVIRAEEDILSLRPLYEERGDRDMIALLDRAVESYPTPEEATNACQELFKEKEYDLSLTCITRATEQWPAYRDGWVTRYYIALFLGRANEATRAERQARQLDPTVEFYRITIPE